MWEYSIYTYIIYIYIYKIMKNMSKYNVGVMWEHRCDYDEIRSMG